MLTILVNKNWYNFTGKCIRSAQYACICKLALKNHNNEQRLAAVSTRITLQLQTTKQDRVSEFLLSYKKPRWGHNRGEMMGYIVYPQKQSYNYFRFFSYNIFFFSFKIATAGYTKTSRSWLFLIYLYCYLTISKLF